MSQSISYVFVDGNNLAYRSFYGVKALTNPEGLPVNAVYGFFNSLLNLKEQFPFEHCVVCFDCSRSKKRTALLEAYKANRSPMPEEFKVQIPHIKALLHLWGMLCCEKEGVEADDLMGAWSTWSAQQALSAAIVSSDKDLMQCVNAYISQIIPHAPNGWKRCDRQAVLDKMGVYPEQVVDYLALIGDTADNYPGLTGVGPKTAAQWLKTYKNLETLFAYREEIQPARFRLQLQENEALLQRNRQLASLDCSLQHIQPFLSSLENLKMDETAVLAYLKKLHLPHLYAKIAAKSEKQSATQEEFLF